MTQTGKSSTAKARFKARFAAVEVDGSNPGLPLKRRTVQSQVCRCRGGRFKARFAAVEADGSKSGLPLLRRTVQTQVCRC